MKQTLYSQSQISRRAWLQKIQQLGLFVVGSWLTPVFAKKADADQESGEMQMNDGVLIVRLRHKIRMTADSPQYTMIVEAVKAGFKQGG